MTIWSQSKMWKCINYVSMGYGEVGEIKEGRNTIKKETNNSDTKTYM